MSRQHSLVIPLSIAGAIVLLGAYLRFSTLSEQSLWGDEVASWQQSAGTFGGMLAATARDNYPPLHNFLLWLSIQGFGDGEWSLRFPSALLGVLNIAAIYWLGAITGGRTAGLIAALLLALSGFHIWYSQEARMYALLALTATCFGALSLRAIDKPHPWILFGVFLSGVGLLYSHAYGALTWISIAAAVAAVGIVSGRALTIRLWLPLQALIGISFVPWIWVSVTRASAISAEGFWIEPLTVRSVLNQVIYLLNGPYPFLLVATGVLLSFLREVRAAPGHRPEVLPRFTLGADARIWILAGWAVGPIVLGILASLLLTPVFIARYIIASLPPLLVLSGIGLSRFAATIPRTAAVLGVTLAVAALGAVSNSPSPRGQWREVAAYIVKTLRGDYCLLITEPRGSLEYYLQGNMPACQIFLKSPEAAARAEISGRQAVLVTDRDHGPALDVLLSSGWSIASSQVFGSLVTISLVREF